MSNHKLINLLISNSKNNLLFPLFMFASSFFFIILYSPALGLRLPFELCYFCLAYVVVFIQTKSWVFIILAEHNYCLFNCLSYLHCCGNFIKMNRNIYLKFLNRCFFNRTLSIYEGSGTKCPAYSGI